MDDRNPEGFDQTRHNDSPASIHKMLWGKSIILIVLAGISIQVSFAIIDTIHPISGKIESVKSLPWTSHWLWEVGFLFLVYLLVGRFGIKPMEFFVLSFAGLVVSFIVELLILLLIGNIFLISPRYYGLTSRFTLETHESGGYSIVEDYDHPLRKGPLFDGRDPNRIPAYEKLLINNQSVTITPFLFWQAGLAAGFDPSSIDAYKSSTGFLSSIELFFTVGPLVIVEAIIYAITKQIPILLSIVGVIFLITKENVLFPSSKLHAQTN